VVSAEALSLGSRYGRCATYSTNETAGCATYSTNETAGCATYSTNETAGCATYSTNETAGCATSSTDGLLAAWFLRLRLFCWRFERL
jgi:hypothetical protein